MSDTRQNWAAILHEDNLFCSVQRISRLASASAITSIVELKCTVKLQISYSNVTQIVITTISPSILAVTPLIIF